MYANKHTHTQHTHWLAYSALCVCLQELEEVLHQAREAQVLVPADDYFEDSCNDADELAETLTEQSCLKS